MHGAPEIIDAVAAPTAVVRVHTTWKDFKALIRTMFDRVYAAGVKLPGHNVIVYRKAGGELDMEVGVQLAAPVELAGELEAGVTPSGQAVTALHVGPYDRLGETYDAMLAWAAGRGLRLGDTFWELYGDWTEDPARLETRIYHLLA
jgi:effector-binding domain-containing protein